MGKTTIEWCTHSWPVVNGCRRASPGCGGANGEGSCYAERLISTRLRHLPKYAGLAQYRAGGPRWTGESRLWRPDLSMPLKLRKPARIFVADMGDLFFDAVSDEDIDAVFGVMAACQYDRDGASRHTFLVLSKRHERQRDYLAQDRRQQWADAAARVSDGGDRLHDQIAFGPEVLPHVHVGVSVENQEWADRRVPVLLETRAALRWISAEPLLGPIDMSPWVTQTSLCSSCSAEHEGSPDLCPSCGRDSLITTWGDAQAERWRNGERTDEDREMGPLLHWCVVGSESGPGARPMEVSWARSIVDTFMAADLPVFVKQIATPAGAAAGVKKGGDPAYWPPGRWPRHLPAVAR